MAKRQNHMRWNSAEVLERQAKAIALRLGGATYQQIVDQNIGYTSIEGARDAIKRGLKEQVNTNAQEVIKEEVARCDSMIRTWWPKAKGGDVKAAAMVAKFMDRRARYLGLDFMDGVAERHVQVQEAQLMLAAEVLRRILADEELELTEEQKKRVPVIANKHLQITA